MFSLYLLDPWSDIGNFDQGLNVVQSALQNWTDGQTRFLGASCPDYLRIHIGMTYALHDQPAKAREIFQSLVASPTNPSDPVASDVAKAFLDNYHDQGSLYKSCVAAQSVIDNRTLTDDDSVPDVYRFGGDLCYWILLPDKIRHQGLTR